MGEEQNALADRHPLADDLGSGHGLAGTGGRDLQDAPMTGGDHRVRQRDMIVLVRT